MNDKSSLQAQDVDPVESSEWLESNARDSNVPITCWSCW